MIVSEYLPLADAGLYVLPGRSREAAAKWARRHLLPNVPHIRPPGTGILFKRSDIDTWLGRYRQEPIDLDQIANSVVRSVLRKRRMG